MKTLKIRIVILATLTVFFGLDIYRVFLPVVIWYLGQYLTAYQLAAYALGTFALTLLVPLIRRAFGEQGTLVLTAGGLAVIHTSLQFTGTAVLRLILSTIGLVLLGWFLPFFHQSRKNRQYQEGFPVLALAFPLAFTLDTFSRTILWAYPLIYWHELGPRLISLALSGVSLLIIGLEFPSKAEIDLVEESPLKRALPLLGLGPFLYLAMALLVCSISIF